MVFDKLQTYQPAYPPNVDIDFLKKLWKEYYQRFPTLTYRSLKETTSTVHDFYNHSTRTQRGYTDYSLPIRIDIAQDETQNLGKMGIDNEKRYVFYICFPLFEEIIPVPGPDHLRPKIGDVIIFEYEDAENQEWEVRTVKLVQESFFAHSNYCFERELRVERPDKGK